MFCMDPGSPPSAERVRPFCRMKTPKRHPTKPVGALATVRTVLHHYATRGAFRSFAEVPARGRKATFRFNFGKVAPTHNVKKQPTSLTLQWSASTGATSYEYCYDSTNNAACDGTWTVAGTALQGRSPDSAGITLTLGRSVLAMRRERLTPTLGRDGNSRRAVNARPLIAAVVSPILMTASAQSPVPLPDLLTRATQYVIGYEQAFSILISEEHFVQEIQRPPDNGTNLSRANPGAGMRGGGQVKRQVLRSATCWFNSDPAGDGSRSATSLRSTDRRSVIAGLVWSICFSRTTPHDSIKGIKSWRRAHATTSGPSRGRSTSQHLG